MNFTNFYKIIELCTYSAAFIKIIISNYSFKLPGACSDIIKLFASKYESILEFRWVL